MQSRHKLTIGVDLDGVCVDYESYFRNYINDSFGKNITTKTSYWNFSDWGITREEWAEYHSDCVNQHRLFLKANPVEGAVAGIKELEASGHRVVFVTNRANFTGVSFDLVEHDTSMWLLNNGINFNELIFTNNKSDAGCDLYIDDAPHVIEDLIKAGAPYIIFDALYNYGIEGPRATSWAEVVSLVNSFKLISGPTNFKLVN